MTEEQLLRDRLHAEVASIDLPPGLVGVVETRARRRRRTRMLTVATAAVVVGGVAVLPDRAPVDPAAACRPPATATAPDLGPAPASTDISAWGFRGDPALQRLFTSTPEAAGSPPTRLLLAQPVGGGSRYDGTTEFAFALAVQLRGSWWVEVGIARNWTTRPKELDRDTEEPLRPLPAPVPGAEVSAVAQGTRLNDANRLTTMLVVLAPPGTGVIDYSACPGEDLSVVARGDALLILRIPGPRPGPTYRYPLEGRLTVTGASGGPVYSGPVDDSLPDTQLKFTSWRSTMQRDDYLGWYLRFTRPGQRAEVTRLLDTPPRTAAWWEVTVSCWGRGSTVVRVRGRTAEVPCNGDPEGKVIYRGPFDLRTDVVLVTAGGAGANHRAYGYIGPAD